MYNWHDGNKNNLRIIEAQIVQKRKNNEARPKFTGSYKKAGIISKKLRVLLVAKSQRILTISLTIKFWSSQFISNIHFKLHFEQKHAAV